MSAPELKNFPENAWLSYAIASARWGIQTSPSTAEYIRKDLHDAKFALGFAAGKEAAAIHYENGFPSWDVFAHAAKEIRAIPTPVPLAAALALPEVRALVAASEAVMQTAAHADPRALPVWNSFEEAISAIKDQGK